MRIIVYCPGSWTYNLNSPERGEGRWAQNFSIMLAAAGYDVWACSGGRPKKSEQFGVKLISESDARSKGKFDLYFDSAWWQGKNPVAKANHYFAVLWSPEKRFYNDKLPDNRYIAYPFDFQKEKFINKPNPHNNKAFCLPARYCVSPGQPNFGKNKFVWSCRFQPKKNVDAVIGALNQQYDRYGLSGIWMNSKDLDKNGLWRKVNKKIIAKKLNRTPYNEIRNHLNSASVVVPVEGRASVLDAISLGTAPLAYERGTTFPYLNKIAKEKGLLIPENFTAENVLQVFNKLLSNEDVYKDYVAALQENIYYHTQEGAHQKFKEMLEEIYKA